MSNLRKRTYLLGIDAGTTSLKTGLYDVDGQLLALAGQEYPTFHPKPGWAEHPPEQWWDALKKTVSKVLATSGIPSDLIAGIGVDSLGPTVVSVDKNGKPLRPAIIWMDTRGGPHNAFPKLLWIRDNQPDITKKTHKVLFANGFLIHKLTGQYSADMPQVWWNNKEVAESLGDLMDKFPDIYQMSQVVGEVTAEAAKETGLATGTPVVAGSADGIVANYGSGLVKAGRTGEFTGQSAVVMMVTDKEHPEATSRGLWHSPGVVPGTWEVAGGMSSGGGLYKWFRDELGGEESEAAARTGLSPFEIMDLEASKVPAGSDNLVILPYFNGERSPIWDSNARGVMFGLSYAHTKAHIARALMESVVFGFRHIIDTAQECGVTFGEMRSMGGGSKSRLWLQIKSDVLGIPIRPVLSDAEPLGDAVLAGLGVGLYRDPVETCERLVKLGKVIEPDMEAHKNYTKLYNVYRKLYVSVKPLFNELLA